MEGAKELMEQARQKIAELTKQNDAVLAIGTTHIKKSAVQAVQAMDDAENCTYIFLIGGARVQVKENLNEVLKLLNWK